MDFGELLTDVNSMIRFAIGLGSTFIFTALGSLTSELYMLTIAKSRRISLNRFFVSTLCGGFLSLFLGEYIGCKLTITTYYSMCFLFGLVGFEVALKATRLDFWIELYNKKKNKKK